MKLNSIWISSACVMTVVAAAPVQIHAQAREFNIPAGPLKGAISAYVRQSGRQVIFKGSEMAGMRSNGAHGPISADQALKEILEGTGFRVKMDTSGAIAIVRTNMTSSIESGDPDATSHAAAAGEGVARASESEFSGSDIIVTAQRKEQRLQDVPVSVTVTTGQFLAERNITDLQDLTVRLPSVRLANAPGASLINIRGVGSGINAGFEQSVGTFVDGLYRGRSRATAAGLFDLERVEVLKGPQTTFFGNNVIAGALNITTRKPGTDFGYNLSALYAPADGEYAVEAGVDIPLSERFRARAAGKAFGMDGYVTNSLLRTKEPHKRDWVGRISLAADLSDDWQAELRFDHGELNDHGHLSTELIGCPPAPAYGPASGLCAIYLASGQAVDDRFDYRSASRQTFFKLNYSEAGLTNHVSIGDLTLTSTTGFYKHDNNAQLLSTPLPAVIPSLAGIVDAGLPFYIIEGVKQFSQEIRMESPSGGFLEYTGGLYYGREKLSTSNYTGFYYAAFGARAGLPYTSSTPVTGRQILMQTSNTYSAFFSLSFNITSALKLNASARYSIVQKHAARDHVFGSAAPYPNPNTFVPAPPAQDAALSAILVGVRGTFPDPDRTDRKFMPSVNMQYKFNDEITGYGSYTKGFKAGGFALSRSINTFDPETVDAFEVGLKANLFDRLAFLSLAAFHSKYKGLQEAVQNTLSNGVIEQRIVNVGRAISKGIEFGAIIRPSSWIDFTTDISYLDARYGNYRNAPCTTLGNVLVNGVRQDAACINGAQILDGKRKAYAPKWSGNAGMVITIPVEHETKLTLNPSLYFSSRYYQSATADPLLEQKGYMKFDARIAIGSTDRRWELALIGKNLTDRRTASFRNVVPSSLGSYFLATERPRSVALQFSISR